MFLRKKYFKLKNKCNTDSLQTKQTENSDRKKKMHDLYSHHQEITMANFFA